MNMFKNINLFYLLQFKKHDKFSFRYKGNNEKRQRTKESECKIAFALQ